MTCSGSHKPRHFSVGELYISSQTCAGILKSLLLQCKQTTSGSPLFRGPESPPSVQTPPSVSDPQGGRCRSEPVRFRAVKSAQWGAGRPHWWAAGDSKLIMKCTHTTPHSLTAPPGAAPTSASRGCCHELGPHSNPTESRRAKQWQQHQKLSGLPEPAGPYGISPSGNGRDHVANLFGESSHRDNPGEGGAQCGPPPPRSPAAGSCEDLEPAELSEPPRRKSGVSGSAAGSL